MIRALRSAGLRRSAAVFLLAVFIGAGTALPGPDALLHHWGGPDAADHRPHVEPAGGCAAHAESCTLGRTATGAGATLAHAPTVRLQPGGGAAAELPPAHPHPAAHAGALPQSRAPPVPIG